MSTPLNVKVHPMFPSLVNLTPGDIEFNGDEGEPPVLVIPQSGIVVEVVQRYDGTRHVEIFQSRDRTKRAPMFGEDGGVVYIVTEPVASQLPSWRHLDIMILMLHETKGHGITRRPDFLSLVGKFKSRSDQVHYDPEPMRIIDVGHAEKINPLEGWQYE